MMQNYFCTFCRQLLGEFDIPSILERRRRKGPDFIQVICPHCKHVNPLRHDPESELRK